MNLFKTKGIILNIKKRENDDDIYTLFSYDYGKIFVQKKRKSREKPLDIGYIIQCEVVTQEGRSIHKIKNLRIKSQFLYEGKEFTVINEYLSLLALLKRLTPDGVPIQEIYKVISTLHKLENISEEKIILGQLKVLDILGLLKGENSNPILQKILRFIHENRIDTIYKLKGIDESIKKELKRLVLL